MKLAFLAYNCAAGAGRRRILRFLLDELYGRGHTCRVYSTCAAADALPGVDWRQVVPGHRRKHQQFIERVQADLSADPVDGVVGLDPYPGLDVYLALEPLAAIREGNWRQRLFASPELAHREEGLVGEGKVHVVFPTEAQRDRFLRVHTVAPERAHVLGPGLGPDRSLPEDPVAVRRKLRSELEIEEGEFTLLFVGNDFAAGGLDLAIETLSTIKEEQPSITSRLLVAGGDKPGKSRRLARRLKVDEGVHFLGVREDMVDLMLAADLLLLPCAGGAAGTALLEAIAMGLPSVVAEDFGYAHHVKAARAGILLAAPVTTNDLERAVMRYLDGIFRADCRESARLYARLTDLGVMYRESADLLERLLG